MASRARRLTIAVLLFVLFFVLFSLTLDGTRSEGAGVRRLTNTPRGRLSLNPTLSGDGRRLAFESNADLASTGGPEAFRVLASGLAANASPSELARGRGPAPALSQDGTRAVFASHSDPLGTNRDGNSEIFLSDDVPLTNYWQQLPIIG